MYKVFINNKPLILTDNPSEYRANSAYYISRFLNEKALLSAIHLMELSKDDMGVVMVGKDVESLWEMIQKHFTLIEAAGGLVKHSEKGYLFILRHKKWDLPKGKIEKAESPKEAAMREVEEECGIDGLQIVHPLQSTYHTYTEKGKKMLKKTHWFRMETATNKSPVPQNEEGIEEVRWLQKDELSMVLESTFQSIAEVMKEGISD